MTPEQRARQLKMQFHTGAEWSREFDVADIAAVIREAVAEQRERDAKIAEQTHAELDAELSPEGCTDTGLEIARRIREGQP